MVIVGLKEHYPLFSGWGVARSIRAVGGTIRSGIDFGEKGARDDASGVGMGYACGYVQEKTASILV